MGFGEPAKRLKKLVRADRIAECDKSLHKTSLARQGKVRFIIVIEDPPGNSSLIKEDRIS